MRKQLEGLLAERLGLLVAAGDGYKVNEKVALKREALGRRGAEIVRAKGSGAVTSVADTADEAWVDYTVHYELLIRQEEELYIEEEQEQRRAFFQGGRLLDDWAIEPIYKERGPGAQVIVPSDERLAYKYNRLKAVRYAERWWNEFNPAYPKFNDDCTNYISQCLHAGGIPMWGQPNKSKGWWMEGKSWSYSWTVANALCQTLAASGGIRTEEVGDARQLDLGDIICLDFQGDGRWDHNLIVTAKDRKGNPYVNAHTANSRRRYWAYEDSSAYTPNIKYRFFRILDGV